MLGWDLAIPLADRGMGYPQLATKSTQTAGLFDRLVETCFHNADIGRIVFPVNGYLDCPYWIAYISSMDDFEDLNPERAARSDPFRPVDMTIEYVSAAAGKQKTRTAIRYAVAAAKDGRKTILAMITRELIGEMVAYARSLDASVKVDEISTEPRRPQYQKGTVHARIIHYIKKFANGPGRILFITHEGFYRVGTWPGETCCFDLILDEASEVVLSRKPFQLPHSHWALTSFLDTRPIPTTLAERAQQANQKAPPEFTDYPDESNTYDPDGNLITKGRPKSDDSWLKTYEVICTAVDENGKPKSSDEERKMAAREGNKLLAKRNAWETWKQSGVNIADRELAMTYYLLTAKPDYKQEDELLWIKLRSRAAQVDDIFKYLDPVATWALQDAMLFTNMEAWNRMVVAKPSFVQKNNSNRYVSIIGFRRPDKLAAFGKVTIMSALFKFTLMYSVWNQLGITFVPSQDIVINDQTTHLGKRRLNIYWLYDEGWSIKRKEDSGGIEPILNLIRQSGVIAADAEVCVVLNKEDGGPEDPMKVIGVFPKAIVMPHSTRGQNRFRVYHKLMYLAALNPNTFDIHWLESVLGVNADQQRIARTGLEVYQTAMRTSLRDPDSTADVDVIVMDKAVAEWLVQWFEPAEQVSVYEIDSTGVIQRKKGIGGRPRLLGDRKLTQSEKNRRHREKKRQKEDEERKQDAN